MATSEKNLKATWDSQSVSRLLPQFMRHWRMIVLMTLAGLLIAVIALLSVRPRYEVSGTLMLQLGRENTAPPTVSESRVMPAMKRAEDLATEIEIMSSQQLVKDVVNHFGEDFFYKEPPAVTLTQKTKRLISRSIDFARDVSEATFAGLGLRRKLSKLEKVVLALQTGIEIEPARKSDVTRISMQISDPQAGEQILNKFIEFYLAKHLEVYRSAKARPFLEAETASLLAAIKQLQDRRIEFKNHNDIFSGEIQRKLLLDQLETSKATKSELIGEMVRLNSEMDSSQKLLAAMPRELETQNIKQRNPLLATLETKFLTLQGDRDAARLRFNENSRSLKDLDDQIAAFKPKLDDTPPLVIQSITTALNSAKLDLEREIDAKKIQLDGLNSRMVEIDRNREGLEKRLREMETSETQLRDLERELELKELSYTMYRKSAEQARLAAEMDSAQISNVVVIDPPTASLRPVWPNLKIWLAAGGLAGFCASLCIVLLGDTIRPRVRAAAEVAELTGVDVLATIPEVPGLDHAKLRVPAFGDALQHLAEDLLAHSPQRKSILVTASRCGEGTTQVTVNLALALAESGASQVLLIDANAPSPKLHKLFGLSSSPGIAGWTADEPIPIQKTAMANLSVITAGEGKPQADRGAHIQKLQSLAEALAKQEFNFVIWDSPAFLEHSEGKRLARLTDGLLLVIELNQVLLSDLRQVREQLQRASIQPLGAILNRVGRYTPRLLRS